MFSNIRFYLIAACLLAGFQYAGLAQAPSADALFLQARKESFENKNYSLALSLCNQALTINPAYNDVALFKGQLFSWSNQPDSAQKIYQALLLQHPANKEVLVALIALAYGSNHFTEALAYCNTALLYHANDKEVLLKKAQVMTALGTYKKAQQLNALILKNNPTDKEAKALAATIKSAKAKNFMDVDYQYSYFDKQFATPWHLASLRYTRQTSGGSVTGAVNYANRYQNNGLQVGVETYQHLSKKVYVYAEGSYALTKVVFPLYKGAFSLYANLPKSFEGEAGVRYLKFAEGTMIYTLAMSKYWKNYWFNFRTYLTPFEGRLSQAYAINGRYYFKTANDYLFLSLGKGISPDDKSNNQQLNTKAKALTSAKISAGLRKGLNAYQTLSITGGYTKQEYAPSTYGNQLDIGVGFQQRF